MFTEDIRVASRAGARATRSANFVLNSPALDSELISLAPELAAAANPYLSYDRDNEVTRADPDYDEAIETGRRLWRTVEAVTEKIFVHQPETLAGLLVVAHAATIAAEERWDEKSEFVGPDGRLLRLVCNGLFRLAGVDWRGRLNSRACSFADGAQKTSLDAALIPLAEAAIAEERAANAVAALAEHDVPAGTFARSMQLLELVTSVEARTTSGLAAKARVLLTHIPKGHEFDGDWRCEALSLSIARDVARLAEAG